MAYLRYQLSNIHIFILEITLTNILFKFQLHIANNTREYPLLMFTIVNMKYFINSAKNGNK